MDFGQRLRLLRENRGLTQKELGQILNVSESTIGMYERGEREPNFETLEKIADYFEVQVDYLLGRDPSNLKMKYDDLDVEERQIIRELEYIADKNGYKLTDPKFLQIVEAAFEFAKRMPKDQHNQQP